MPDEREVAVTIKDVHKEFILPQNKNSTFKQTVVNIVKKNNKVTQKVLDGVSFEIKKGEFFGIVGRNGSGKSTLLKILAGVYSPTAGQVYVNGSLTPFIELGVGFNPELSGRDNVYLNGALLGFNRKQMDKMYDEIVEFAELEAFMDQKLKNYSSGMQVRLAFSVAIRAESDILLIDEVLAVGDANFQKKSIEVFDELKRQGRTIVFVTHAMDYVRDFCDRVAVIDSSKLLFVGDTEKAIDIYNKLNVDREKLRTESENKAKESVVERLGNGQALISEHKIFNDEMKETIELESGKNFTVKLKVLANEKLKDCAIGVMFRKDPHENLYGLNNYYQGDLIKSTEKGDKFEMTFTDRMPLNPGNYYVSFSIAGIKDNGYEDFDNLNNIMKINVVGPEKFWGIVRSEPKITVGGKNDKNRF